MLRNHLLVALRNFKKRKAFTLINTLGLTVGMTIACLILTYARYELSYDGFHSKADDIYRVTVDIYNGESFQVADAQCYPGVGQLALASFPEVQEFAMVRNIGRLLFKNGDRAFNEDRAYFANPGWLTVFDWNVVKGDRNTALDKPDMVVISESTAKKYFGDEDPMGKQLDVVPGGAEVPMIVNGVFKDVPANAHLKFDILISYESAVRHMKWEYENWNGNNEFLYLESKGQALDTDDFKRRFNTGYYQRTEETFESRGDSLTIQSLTDIHLNSDRTYEAETNGSQSVVNILLMVAVFVLVIAWVNYINLATARAMERGKEVGVRKVLGSTKKSLVIQFLTESILLNFIALILMVTCIQGILPFFNQLAGVELRFDLLGEPDLLLMVLGIFLVGALASGIYPSLFLSNYRAITVLTGKLKDSRRGLFLRKGLVVFQFMITMLLLVGTITIYNQVNHMRSQKLGVNIDQTIVVRSPVVVESNDIQVESRKLFRSELSRNALINSITFSETVVGQGTNDMSSTTALHAVEGEMGKGVNFSFFRVDDQFLPSFELELLAGRNFDEAIETPFEDSPGQFKGMLINETSRKIFGFETNEDAIGKKINRWGRIFEVIGVFTDYNHHSLKTGVDPTALFYDKYGYGANYVSIKVNAGTNPGETYKNVLADIENIYREVYPQSDFDYFFLDEQFDEQYRADRRFGSVFTVFAFVTIFVAVLGLFGLVLYEIQQRVKEIGIRKVLGASIPAIIHLLATNFLKLIIISVVVALPISYLGASEWLSTYAYRIDLSWYLFVLPAAVLFTLALVLITLQSIKAANRNLVDSLRYE